MVFVRNKHPRRTGMLAIDTTTERIESKGGALPHQKCYRKKGMPHFENVTQIIIRVPEGGHPNGVTYERETGGNGGI
jgi:hypothetical protein